MTKAVQNDLNIQYPLIDKIQGGQVIAGWDRELDEVLEEGLRGAVP